MNNEEKVNIVMDRFLSKIDQSDIRALVFVPPIVCLLGFITWFFIMDLITGGKINTVHFDLTLSLIMFVLCFTGFAQIRKRETPVGPRVIRGNLAIINGVGIILLFGPFGIYLLWHAISLVFIK
jgi:hypothetical protein